MNLISRVQIIPPVHFFYCD